jgi:cytochrome P450
VSQSLRLAQDIPGNFGLPFLGESAQLFRQKELFYWQHFQRYGTIFKTQVAGMKVACLIGPDANQFVLKDQAEKFSSRLGWSFLEPLLGEGILLQDGQKHQALRKLMYPAFHGEAVAGYCNRIKNTAEKFLENWQDRSPILLIEDFRKLTLTIAFQLLLGIKAEREIEELSQYFLDMIDGIRTLLRWDIPITKFGRAREARRQLEKFIPSLISQRRKQGHSAESPDVLDLLLKVTDETGLCLTDSEIVTQIFQLLFGGHETTAKFLCWSLFELGSHPNWLEKLREEQTQVVGSQSLSVSHLKHFTQLSYVIKEVERLYPPIYTIPRGVIEDVEYAGYQIPQGWRVVISPFLTHRLPELYSQPESFEPNRFAPPREEDKKHPFALIGFGGGAHKCLGYELAKMEIKIILSILLCNYEWSVTPARAAVAPIREANKIGEIVQAWVRPI